MLLECPFLGQMAYHCVFLNKEKLLSKRNFEFNYDYFLFSLFMDLSLVLIICSMYKVLMLHSLLTYERISNYST